MSMEVDDIYQQIRENLDKVKARERNVTEKEKQVAEEASKIEAKSNALEEARFTYEQRAADLEKEKLKMSNGLVDGDEIVQVNVQGEILSTRRNTLTQFPNSRLAYLFNGRWDKKTLRDKDGRVFLDVQPILFRKLLNYLTSRNLTDKVEKIPPPLLPHNEFIHFKTMLEYLEIELSVYPNLGAFSETLKSRCIVLSDDSSIATNISEGTGFVLGCDVYTREIVEFVLMVESLADPWMFLGIMACSDTDDSAVKDNSFNMNPLAYGWADKGGLWISGTRAPDCTIPPGVLVRGMRIDMTLDCASQENKLTLKLSGTEHSQVITLPSGQSWRLHINLVGHKDSVRLVKAERQSSEQETQ